MSTQHWNGPERRKDSLLVENALGEIKTELVRINQFIDNETRRRNEDYNRHQNSLEKHEGTLYGNGNPGLTTKIKAIESIEDDLKSHTNTDRWMFGVITTLLLAIFGRVFIK